MKTITGGGGSAVLGCIGFDWIGPLIEVHYNLTVNSYISQILEPMHFWQKIQRKYPNWVLMQVNAPCHTARVVAK